jgi:hypothetical protein
VDELSGPRARVVAVLAILAVLLLAGVSAIPPSSQPASLNARGGSGLRLEQTPPSDLDCGSYTASLVVASPMPAAGPAGTHITIDGSGFYSGGGYGFVQIQLVSDNGTYLVSVAFVSNTTGTFSVNTALPGVGVNGGLALGTYYLWAGSAASPANCADHSFALTAIDPPDLACENWNPELNVTSPVPAIGPAGTSVELNGSGFYDNNVTQIYWTQAATAATYTLVGNVTSNATGAFHLAVDVPSGFVPGNYTFWGWESTYPYPCGGAMWNLTTGPSLVLTPSYGPGDTNVTVTGSGFNSSDTGVTITGEGLLFPLPCALSDGSITVGCYFIDFGGVAGPHTITAVGNVVGGPDDTGTATFTLYPTIFLSPTTGVIGSSLTVTGIDFSAGPAAVTVSFDGQLLTRIGGSDCAGGSGATLITPDDLGGFNCTFTVPSWATLGPNSVQGDDTNTSELTAVVTFTLTTPELTLSPMNGPTDTVVTASGAGFSSAVGISFSISTGGTIGSASPCSSSDAGSFTGCVFAVYGPEIAYTITATGADSSALPADSASASFTVTAGLTITSTPLTGPPGTSIVVTGSGYTPGYGIELEFGVTYSTALLAHPCIGVPVNASGGFTCMFSAPDVGQGVYSVWSLGGGVVVTVSTNTFTIVAELAFSSTPLNGPPGTSVNVTGLGYVPGDGVELEFGVTLPTAILVESCVGVPVNASGGFTCSFPVPEVGTGMYMAWSSGGGVYLTPSTNAFSVVAGLAFSSTPLTGPPGSSVNVTGLGYVPGAGAELEFGETLPTSILIAACVGTPVNASGGFTCTFSVPDVEAGVYTVWSSGGGVYLTPSTNTFSVVAELAFSSTPLTGPPGTSVNVTGLGYVPGTGAELGFGATFMSGMLVEPCVGIPVNASGGFTCTFSVPDVAAGVYITWSSGGGVYLTVSTNNFTVTTPEVVGVSSTTGTPGPITFSVSGLAPNTLYDVYLDTTQGMESTLLGTCTSSAGGAITDCTVVIPTGLATGTYYVDLFQDPAPPPYIFSVFNFTVPASGASHPLLSTLDYEIIAGVIVLAAIGAAVLVSRRRSGRSPPPSANPPSGERNSENPGD